MRTITTNVYTYDELSDDAKRAARDWYERDVAPDVAQSRELENVKSYRDFWERNCFPWLGKNAGLEEYVDLRTYGYDTYQEPNGVMDQMDVAHYVCEVIEGLAADGITDDIDTDDSPCLFEEAVLEALELNLIADDGYIVEEGMREALEGHVDQMRENLGTGLGTWQISVDFSREFVWAVRDAVVAGIEFINEDASDVYDEDNEAEDIRANEWEFYEDGRPFGGRAA